MSTRTSRRHIFNKFAHGQVAVNLRACLVSAGSPRANGVGKKNRSMTDIIDGTAYMMLVTCNAQGELSALERGMHALRSGMDVKACGSTVTAKAQSPESSARNIRRSRVLTRRPFPNG